MMLPPLLSSVLEEVGNTSSVLANAKIPRRQLLTSLVVGDDADGKHTFQFCFQIE